MQKELEKYNKDSVTVAKYKEGTQPIGAELVEWLRGKSLYGYGISRKLPVKPLPKNRIQ